MMSKWKKWKKKWKTKMNNMVRIKKISTKIRWNFNKMMNRNKKLWENNFKKSNKIGNKDKYHLCKTYLNNCKSKSQ